MKTDKDGKTVTGSGNAPSEKRLPKHATAATGWRSRRDAVAAEPRTSYYDSLREREAALRRELGYTMSSAMRGKLTSELREINAAISTFIERNDIRKVELP
jgi:hypothetical protein